MPGTITPGFRSSFAASGPISSAFAVPGNPTWFISAAYAVASSDPFVSFLFTYDGHANGFLAGYDGANIWVFTPASFDPAVTGVTGFRVYVQYQTGSDPHGDPNVNPTYYQDFFIGSPLGDVWLPPATFVPPDGWEPGDLPPDPWEYGAPVPDGWTPPSSYIVCEYTIDPESVAVPASAGDVVVFVSANSSSCPWTAHANDVWNFGTDSGTGAGSTSISWTQNLSADPRVGTATIAGHTLTIHQAGAVAAGGGVTWPPYPPAGPPEAHDPCYVPGDECSATYTAGPGPAIVDYIPGIDPCEDC